jgi:aquaporin Z
MLTAVRRHWPEYLMEGGGLAIFMISAALFGTVLEHPESSLRAALTWAPGRRVLMGVCMGLTAVGIIHSPWGKQSGAHLNPAVTITFFRLGKLPAWDAVFYVVAQFVGGAGGLVLAALVLGSRLGDPAVNYVVTAPGSLGAWVALLAEFAISMGLMTAVLVTSNSTGLSRFTGLVAGTLVALYITFEAPLSGMSMNPARTTASALSAQVWSALWIYFVAPPLGMLLAAEAYVRWNGARAVRCAKLHHVNDRRCIFRCGYAANPSA